MCRTLRRAGHGVHLVGGAVRDLLMQGRASPGEWDIATSARPEEVSLLFPRTIPTGARHGTVTVLSGGESYEVTTYRGEAAYSDGRHPDSVTFLGDIEGDLARRDFTVNAMAMDPETGSIIDPHRGQEDLLGGILRAVGDPLQRFSEDGLRTMRAARFTAVLELEPAADLLPAMIRSKDVFIRVSAERKRDELKKMLGARRPSRGLALLERAGYVGLIFPGLERTVGCFQGGRHLHDVWTHGLLSVDACRNDDWRLRLAALLHDAGKPSTAGERPGGDGARFIGHEQIGADLAARWLQDLRLGSADVEHVVHLVRHHMVMYGPEWGDAAVRRFVRRVGRERVSDVLDLASADVKAQGLSDDLLPMLAELGARVADVIEGSAAMGRADLAITGTDLMEGLGLHPGPVVGRILDELLEAVTDDPALNVPGALMDLARGIIARAGTETDRGGGTR